MTIEQWNSYIINLECIKDYNLKQLIEDYMEIKKAHRKEKCIYQDSITIFIRILKQRMIELASLDENAGIENIDLSYEDFTNQDFSFPGESASDVNEMVFINGNFEYTNFTGANLDAISFYRCNLSNTLFMKAFLECAYFVMCNMTGCNMDRAHMLASYIDDCIWTNASVRGTNLLEITAKKVAVTGLNIDDKTSINDADFDTFDWSAVNVSGLSISIDQVKYFNECANGGNRIKVYNSELEKHAKGSKVVEETILDSILEQYTTWKCSGSERIEVFISYACPNEKELASQIFHQVHENGKSVWMDTMLEKEKKLNEQLEYVLQSCQEAIILLSEVYKVKAWTRYEMIRLSEESKKRDLRITIYNFLNQKVDLCNVLNDERYETYFTNVKVINMFNR